jgi:TPR repeat protein
MTEKIIKKFLFIVFFISSQSWADYKSSEEAYKSKDYARALQECQVEANNGDKDCQSQLGRIYKNGFGVPANQQTAIIWLKKAAAQGQMYAEENLGDSYRRGLGVSMDYQEALRLFRISAEKGNPWAFNSLGNMYRFGLGVEKNLKEAVNFFRLAADKGNPAGQANLADIYRLGELGEVNGDEAFQWASKSAKQNYALGLNMLGLLYRDGIGVRQDTEKAIQAFQESIKLSPPNNAFCNLASIYYRGFGVPRNLEEAAKYAEIGTQRNESNCMNILANILVINSPQVKKDPIRAFELAKRSLELGNKNALNTLGYMYRDGLGVDVDFQMALKYLNQGMDAGDFNAMVNLGKMFYKGLGVPKDVKKANEYFEIAQAKINTLGPGNKQFIINYFEQQKIATTANKDLLPNPSISEKQQSSNESSPIKLDKSQQELLAKLEKLQKQIEVLQSSTNTINASQDTITNYVLAPRKALVIGNDTYKYVNPLQNAVQDAKALSETLKTLGYKVSLFQNLDEKGFKKALRDFRGSLDGGDEVLFFFAGHGVQLGSANYLLPVDIKGDNAEQVKDEAVELQRVLDDLKTKDVKFSLAIIDACRDNPFKSSGRALGGRGLAPTTAATGQMVMFSAGSGQQALDKLGDSDKNKNGLFTRVLLNEMVKPQVSVDKVLRNVRMEVVRLAKSVGHEQTPALYDQAVGDFYFNVKKQ